MEAKDSPDESSPLLGETQGGEVTPRDADKERAVRRYPVQRSVTVEPIMLLYHLGVASMRTTTEQFVYAKFMDSWDGSATNLTANDTNGCGGSLSIMEEEVQSSTANFLLVHDLIIQFPGILLAFWAGSYSDRYGRKVALLVPCLGVFLRGLGCFLIALFELNISFLFIGAVLDGVSGGQCVFATVIYAYITDVSQTESRSVRILVVQIMGSIGMAVAQLSVGYIIYYTGWIYPFLIIAGLLFCNLPIILCYIQETVFPGSHSKRSSVRSCIKKTIAVVHNNADRGNVLIIRLILVMTVLASAIREGMSSATILYLLKSPICFSSILVGYYTSSLWAMGSLVSFIVIRFIGRCVSEYGLLQLTLVSTICSKLWMLLPLDGNGLAFGYAGVASGGFAFNTMVRAALSKLTPLEDQGAMSSCVTIATLTGTTGGTLLFDTIYSATVSFYPETIFCIGVGFVAVAMILNSIIIVRQAKR